SVVLLWLTLRFGTEVKGAKRWISAFGQSIQPSEFVKPAFAVIGAWLFAEGMKQKGVPARSIATAIMALIVAALLLQPDIGQSALVLATWAVLLFLSGISWLIIFGLLIAGVGLLVAAYTFFPHFARRIDAFINPEAGAGHGTYQIEKALQSLLEGGWFGRGPGESLAKKLIPDAHADYIFSAAAGEPVRAACGLDSRHPVRAAVQHQPRGEPQPHAAQGHDAALRLLWRHLDDRRRVRHGPDAGAHPQEARGAAGDRASALPHAG